MTTTQGEHAQTALAHELFAAAQLAPGEGIEDAVRRIAAALTAAQEVPKCEFLAHGCDTPSYCQSVQRCTARDEKRAAPAQPAAPAGAKSARHYGPLRDADAEYGKPLSVYAPTAQAAPAAGAVAGPVDDIDAIALARYKVVPSHDSMFHRFAVVAGDGKQQLYLGRETECQNMARKFAGAFLDGAFYQSHAAAPTQAAQADSVLEDAARLLRQILAASQDGDSDTHLSAHFVSRIETITKPGGAA